MRAVSVLKYLEHRSVAFLSFRFDAERTQDCCISQLFNQSSPGLAVLSSPPHDKGSGMKSLYAVTHN